MKKLFYTIATLTLIFTSCKKEETPTPVNTTITNQVNQVETKFTYILSTDWNSTGSGIYHKIIKIPTNKLISVLLDWDFNQIYYPLPETINGYDFTYSLNYQTNELLIISKKINTPFQAPQSTVYFNINYLIS